jgi:hypothetical protein
MKIYFIILCILIILFIYYSSLKEHFTNNNNVNLPFNSKTNCLNKCAPGNNSCYLTGEECTRDSDCYGCKPLPQPPINYKTYSKVIGYNDAGKLTDNMTPDFSVLTTDIGSKAAIYNYSQINKPPPQYNKGINTWRRVYDEGKLLFDKKYNPSIVFEDGILPSYEEMPTLSGEFTVVGPKPANY